MEIVQNENEGLTFGGSPKESRHGIEQPESGLFGAVGDRFVPNVGKSVVDFGDDLGDLSRTSAQLLLEAILIDVGDIGPDRLNPYPVRRRALLFVASSP